MALVKATYTQGAHDQFQDSTVSPATLAAGTLFQRFEVKAFPQKGIKYTGRLGTILSAPTLSKGTVAHGATGGFAAGTYYWKLTAVDSYGGEVASNEVTATVLLHDSQPLTWPAVAGASTYKLYRGTTTGAGVDHLIATTTALTVTDTGAVGTAATPPATNLTGHVVPKAAKTTHGAGS